jgi:hypothetical protein
MTPTEKRRYKRHRKQRLWNIVHAAILFCLTVTMILVLGNLYALTVMQTDALNKLNDLRHEINQTVECIGNADKVAVIEEKAPSGTISGMPLTTDERDLVCRVVAAEARGEDLQGQMAVAQVILDRAVLWDMPVTDVVLADGQFADPYRGEISDSIHLAVANVFEGGVRVFVEPVTHFYSGAEPYWADEKVNRGSIGCHRFLY